MLAHDRTARRWPIQQARVLVAAKPTGNRVRIRVRSVSRRCHAGFSDGQCQNSVARVRVKHEDVVEMAAQPRPGSGYLTNAREEVSSEQALLVHLHNLVDAR